MTPLRQKLIDEIVLRNLSPDTRDLYVSAVSGLAQYYHRSPDQIREEEIKAYLLHLLNDRKLGKNSLRVQVTGLRFFYRQVLHWAPDTLNGALPPMKEPVRRARFYSVEELEQIFGTPGLNPKHRVLLMTAYGAGLRVKEVCQLRLADLLGDRGQIRVVDGKGAKERYTVLSPRLLLELRAYWQLYRPTDWLFTSARVPTRPISRKTAQRVFREAVQRAGLPNRGGIHSLRYVST